jgi:hypothetical protein
MPDHQPIIDNHVRMVLDKLDSYEITAAQQLTLLHVAIDFLTVYWLHTEKALNNKTSEQLADLERLKGDQRLIDIMSEILSIEPDVPAAVSVAKSALAEKLRQAPIKQSIQ